MDYTVIGSIFLGLGLAAAAGFRVFLPLLAMSLVSFMGWMDLGESFSWIGTLPALIALAVATVLEILGYYIPWVDNILDTVAIPLATLAGTGLMAASLTDMNPMFTWGLAIVAGGGTAGAIKSASAGTRLMSSVKTAGIGNPVVSTAETGASISMILLAFFLPVLALIFLGILFFLLYKFVKKFNPLKKKETAVES